MLIRKEVTSNELKRLLALIIYFGLVNVNGFYDFWTAKSLYRGLWTRIMLTHDRFKAMMAMLHIVSFATESRKEKLKKVQNFSDLVCQRSKEL